MAAVASLAKAVCSETYRHAADAAIQVFGGIALAWEHPVQLYFKRARSSEILLGAPAYAANSWPATSASEYISVVQNAPRQAAHFVPRIIRSPPKVTS